VTVWLVAEDGLNIIRANQVTTLRMSPASTAAPAPTTGPAPTGPADGAGPAGGTGPAAGTEPAGSSGPAGTEPGGPGGHVRILAGIHAGRGTETVVWVTLLTFTASAGRTSARVLEELAVALSQAEARDRVGSDPVLFVHGPGPGLDERPEWVKIWHISTELPSRERPGHGSLLMP
jgi:hypothetical protein